MQLLSCLGRAGERGRRLHELHIVAIAKLLWMTTASYEIMNKLVPNSFYVFFILFIPPIIS